MLMMTVSTASCRPGSTRATVNLDLEVHRALERNNAESPYLARQLSVFDDRQVVTRLPGTIVRGASAYTKLDGERRDNNLY
jgi:hypothetical protein